MVIHGIRQPYKCHQSIGTSTSQVHVPLSIRRDKKGGGVKCYHGPLGAKEMRVRSLHTALLLVGSSAPKGHFFGVAEGTTCCANGHSQANEGAQAGTSKVHVDSCSV